MSTPLASGNLTPLFFFNKSVFLRIFVLSNGDDWCQSPFLSLVSWFLVTFENLFVDSTAFASISRWLLCSSHLPTKHQETVLFFVAVIRLNPSIDSPLKATPAIQACNSWPAPRRPDQNRFRNTDCRANLISKCYIVTTGIPMLWIVSKPSPCWTHFSGAKLVKMINKRCTFDFLPNN